jgi:hypothetical protein
MSADFDRTKKAKVDILPRWKPPGGMTGRNKRALRSMDHPNLKQTLLDLYRDNLFNGEGSWETKEASEVVRRMGLKTRRGYLEVRNDLKSLHYNGLIRPADSYRSFFSELFIYRMSETGRSLAEYLMEKDEYERKLKESNKRKVVWRVNPYIHGKYDGGTR